MIPINMTRAAEGAETLLSKGSGEVDDHLPSPSTGDRAFAARLMRSKSTGPRRQPEQMRSVGLGSAQLWPVVAVLCLIAVYVAIATIPTWYTEYRLAIDGPILQRCLGFVAAEVPRPSGESREHVFAITSVKPDGELAKAGVRAGDLPVGYKHGFASGFYQDLGMALEGGDVTFSVMAMADLGKSTGAWRSIHFNNLDLKCN